MGLNFNVEIMQCNFHSEGGYFKHFYTRFKLKRQNQPKQNQQQASLPPPRLHIPRDGTDLKDAINKKGQNLILIRSQADGTGNVAQHPHISSSQEQRGLIQNRRQCLG